MYTLEELYTETLEWVKQDTVKLFNLYIVNIGDGILFFGTKNKMRHVDENNTFMYTIYTILLNIKHTVSKRH